MKKTNHETKPMTGNRWPVWTVSWFQTEPWTPLVNCRCVIVSIVILCNFFIIKLCHCVNYATITTICFSSTVNNTIYTITKFHNIISDITTQLTQWHNEHNWHNKILTQLKNIFFYVSILYAFKDKKKCSFLWCNFFFKIVSYVKVMSV